MSGIHPLTRHVDKHNDIRCYYESSGGGFYVNETQDEKVRAAWGGNYRRLIEIKSRHDPMNLFRHNANIAPAAALKQDAAL